MKMRGSIYALLWKKLLRAYTTQLEYISKNFPRSFGVSDSYAEKKNDNLDTIKTQKVDFLEQEGHDSVEKNESKAVKQVKETPISDEKSDFVDKIVRNARYSGYSQYEDECFLQEDPFQRTIRVLKFDMLRQKENFMNRFGMEYEPKSHKYYYGPSVTDVLIIGGGTMGSACAYFLKEKAQDGLEVTVVEKDTTFRKTSPSLAVIGLNQQFSLPENIEMSLYSAEFLRNVDYKLKINNMPTPDLAYQPYGNLILATEKGAATLEENFKIQQSMGVKTRLLTPEKLNSMFPWLKTDGITLGSLGLEKEGWFDPLMLMLAFKTKAEELGTDYVPGEIVGFQFNRLTDDMPAIDENFRKVRGVVIRRPDGKCHVIKFAVCVIAAGSNSGLVGRLLGLGLGERPLDVPLPIERRRRNLYFIYCVDGPGMNMPLIMDPTGLCIRRVGLTGIYAVANLSNDDDNDDDCDNNESSVNNYFEEKIRPKLAGRIPTLQNADILFMRRGYHECNSTDGSGVIGKHSLFRNVIFACGFDSDSVQHAPAVARMVSELILHSSYNTVDLSRLGFDRFFTGELMHEKRIL